MRLGIMARALVLATVCLAGCAGMRNTPMGQRLFGACLHTYRSGVVAITAAQSTGGATGVARPIPQVIVGPIRVNDKFIVPEDLPGLVNAVPGPQGLECLVPCSFGTEEGKWQFTASAPGHTSRAVNVGASYAVSGRGCPSYNDKGTEVRLNLEPVGGR
jgi:hypothetical protein